MTTAEQMVKMAANGDRQKANYWFRNIRKRHGKAHCDKLLKEIKALKNGKTSDSR